MRRTPALIIGGGPAGTATAILLARAGLPHLLIERTATTGDALCGGFLSWRSLESLTALGIDPDALNPLTLTTARLFVGGTVAEAALPHPARGVSRHRLDSVMMAQAIGQGAIVERGADARVIDAGTVRLHDGSTISAPAIFLATGKRDLRGLARPPEAQQADPSLGLRVRLSPSPSLHRLLDGAIELHLFDRGYVGLNLQEDGSGNLCLAVHRSRLIEAGGPEGLLSALASESPALADRLAWRAPGSIDAVANVPYGWRIRAGSPGLFRLGDQAGVIPSLAGEGMGIAIASGIRAAQAYADGGPDAAPGFQRRLARDLARPLGVAGLIRAAAEHPAAARRLVALAKKAPIMIEIAARLTRITHSRIDAPHRDKMLAAMDHITLSESEWRKKLSAEAYHVLREAGTERAFSGRYNDNKADGIYRCGGCGLELFDSADKYDSGSGWPSFNQPITPTHVTEHRDHSHGMIRIEARCTRCDGHLGHVFPDGPPPTGLRYCMNSLSLDFRARDGGAPR